MSIIAANDSLKVYTNPFAQKTSEANANGSEIVIFDKTVPEAGAQGSASDTVNNTKTKRNIDIDKLIKKYKKDPSKILDELGINFTQQQKDILKVFLQDKKDLKAFLNLVAQENLSADDIFAGVQKIAEKEGSGFFKRVGNVFKTLFKEGISEAWELAKSESVYYAGKVAENMDEIREKRADFSSEGVASIGAGIADTPEIKDHTMHFVEMNQSPGKKLYDENDVLNALGIMQNNTDKADQFLANTQELESIRDSYNNVKYKGSTIINVGNRMTNKEELKDTMMAVAKKNDMTDEYLDNTTENLFQNPNMEETILYTTTAKNSDGTDKFTAGQVNNTSNYLVDKSEEYCAKYEKNVKYYSEYTDYDSEKILEQSTHNAENNIVIEPENSSEYTTDSSYNSEAKENIYNEYYKNSELINTNQNTESDSNEIINVSSSETITINGESYNKNEILETLVKKYGTTLGSSMLNEIENNPKFYEQIKKYSGDRKILEALIKDPKKVEKLKNASASIDNTKLAEMIEQANNETNLNNIIALTQKYGANAAIKMTRESKINNNEEDIGRILSNSTLDTTTQKEKIEELYNGNTKNKLITEESKELIA